MVQIFQKGRRNYILIPKFESDEIQIWDTDKSNLLTISYGTDLTADRTLTFDTEDADRSVKIYSDLILSQDVGEKTSDYTVTATDAYLLIDATNGDVVVTLPSAVGISGREYSVKKIDDSANTITVDASSTETIDDSETLVITSQYEAITIVSDGEGWNIFMAYQPSADTVEELRKLKDVLQEQLFKLNSIEYHLMIASDAELKDGEVQ